MSHDSIEESHDLMHDKSITDGHAYEQQEFLDKRRVIGFMAFLAILMIAAILMTRFLEPFLVAQNQPDAPTTPYIEQLAQRPPGAILQSAPKVDMAEFVASENATIGSYGWVDQERQIARVPIEKAKEMALEDPSLFPARTQGAASGGVAP
jgi:hypothetical protein